MSLADDTNDPMEAYYESFFGNITAENLRYDYLNEETQNYFRQSTSTVVYMSFCLSCTVWQIITAGVLAYRVRKWLHFAVLFETLLSLISIFTSVLNPISGVTCEFRFWVSIIVVNLGGCTIQTILLYKAYICYDRSRSLMILGSFINLGYIALTFIYAFLAQEPTYKDVLGNCVLKNLEWPALAKLGLDIGSNLFLSIAFCMVIYRHYKVFGSTLHRTLLSNGIFFSVGVILSNIICAILVACRAMGGLSADLYCFDWVITSYLLIKQFTMNKSSQQTRGSKGKDEEAFDDEEEEDENGFKAMSNLSDSYGVATMTKATHAQSQKNIFNSPTSSAHLCGNTLVNNFNRISDGVMSETTAVNDSFDMGTSRSFCGNCLTSLPVAIASSIEEEEANKPIGGLYPFPTSKR